jgi:hypothetical protein
LSSCARRLRYRRVLPQEWRVSRLVCMFSCVNSVTKLASAYASTIVELQRATTKKLKLWQATQPMRSVCLSQTSAAAACILMSEFIATAHQRACLFTKSAWCQQRLVTLLSCRKPQYLQLCFVSSKHKKPSPVPFMSVHAHVPELLFVCHCDCWVQARSITTPCQYADEAQSFVLHAAPQYRARLT